MPGDPVGGPRFPATNFPPKMIICDLSALSLQTHGQPLHNNRHLQAGKAAARQELRKRSGRGAPSPARSSRTRIPFRLGAAVDKRSHAQAGAFARNSFAAAENCLPGSLPLTAAGREADLFLSSIYLD